MSRKAIERQADSQTNGQTDKQTDKYLFNDKMTKRNCHKCDIHTKS